MSMTAADGASILRGVGITSRDKDRAEDDIGNHPERKFGTTRGGRA